MTYPENNRSTRNHDDSMHDEGSAGEGRGWITVVLAAVGALVFVVAAGQSAWAAAGTFFMPRQQIQQGVVLNSDDTIDVSVNAAHFTLEFGEVTEPELTVEGAAPWTMKYKNGTLQISVKETWIPFFGQSRRHVAEAVLTLPQHLNGGSLNLDAKVGAGVARVSGNFNHVDLEVGAGDATIEGALRDITADVGVGQATVRGTDVRTANLDISVGSVTAIFDGSAPQDVNIVLSVGDARLTLPQAEYAVVTQGSVSNHLETDSRSTHRITANATLGDISLRSHRD